MNNIITENTQNGRSFFVGEYIDRGSFSKVYTLECCSSKKRFAGKFISKEKLHKFGIFNNVWREIQIHQRLRHPSIVHFLTYIEQERDIVIILEYCSKYSLVHVISTLKTLSLKESKYFMIQIVSAVEYLHRRQIVHRDLKLGNLFVSKSMQIKLGDFGLAVTIEHEGQKRFSRCGTPNYLAPEVINGVGHSYEVDVWALGCILHTMMEGKPPFQGEDTTNTYNNILNCKYSFSPGMDYTAKEFIMSCLQPDPLQRPTASQLLLFEFIASAEIVAEAPGFSFTEKNEITFNRRRSRMSDNKLTKNSCIIKAVDENNHLHHCFCRLLASLRHIKKWKDSKFGEFLAEHNSIVPLVWVNSWMDFSNVYGFSYQLSNNNYGMIFNDDTRMLMQTEEGSFHYCQNDESVNIYQKESIPEGLKKKVRVLMTCQAYMDDSLMKAHEATISGQAEKKANSPAEVFKWVKSDVDIVMFLTNGSVQVNFLTDHTKLILSGFNKTVTLIESANVMRTLKIDTIDHSGCSRFLKDKLYFAKKHIYNFLSGESS